MKIISTAALEPAQRSAIIAAMPGAVLADRQIKSPEEFSDLARDGCDVMLTFRVPHDVTARAPGLRWIQLLSAGADHVLDGGALKGGSITLTTASGIHATPIAEYTMGSMLAYAHHIHLGIRAQIRHQWTRSQRLSEPIDELRGHTIGIVGYGSIGRETARLAAAFGMTVLALKRDPANRRDLGWCPAGLGDPEGAIPSRFFGPAQCDEILRESDYVSVTLPLSAHTRKFIGAREIAAMKPRAYLVNIGRGQVIDEAAMVAALTTGKIGGAGLDVFEHEPLEASSPLWDMENVILTPHISGDSRGYMDKACDLFVENLKRFAANRPLLNLVDPKLGY